MTPHRLWLARTLGFEKKPSRIKGSRCDDDAQRLLELSRDNGDVGLRSQEAPVDVNQFDDARRLEGNQQGRVRVEVVGGPLDESEPQTLLYQKLSTEKSWLCGTMVKEAQIPESTLALLGFELTVGADGVDDLVMYGDRLTQREHVRSGSEYLRASNSGSPRRERCGDEREDPQEGLGVPPGAAGSREASASTTPRV
ncbi:hypothetical protein B0H19DRAFT_1231164 [Mycena capillaripes]|nr:hypothetical protein B0H19DRAFT_1231164 [Mycena capillaripes]